MGDSGGLLVQLLFGDDGIEFCKGMSSGLTLVIVCSCRSEGPPLNSFTTRESSWRRICNKEQILQILPADKLAKTCWNKSERTWNSVPSSYAPVDHSPSSHSFRVLHSRWKIPTTNIRVPAKRHWGPHTLTPCKSRHPSQPPNWWELAVLECTHILLGHEVFT